MPRPASRRPALPRAAVLPLWLAGRQGLVAALALATAMAAAAADPRIESLELRARAQPLEAADAAAVLAAAQSETDTARVHALALRATLLAGHNQLDAAERALQPLQALAPRLPLAASALGWARAALEARRGPAFRAERLVTEALGQLPADAPGALRLAMVSTLARMKENAGHLDDGLRLRQQAVTLADADGVAWRRSETRSSLAYTLLLAQQLDPAREQLAQARALAGEDALALAHVWSVTAFVHDAEKQPEAELQAMREAIAQARRGGSRAMEVLGLANLSDHYLKRGQYTVALSLAREALPLARALGDPNSESVALANAGLALVSLRRLDEGQSHLAQALALAQRAHGDGGVAQLIEETSHYLERAGYLREAFAAAQRLRPLADTLDLRNQQEALVELQERFDHERRQRELDLLQRESQLRAAQLHNHTLQQRVWMAAAAAGVLMLAVGGVLLQRMLRLRRQLVAGNARLLDQSERDPLTGLANRRHLLRRMAEQQGLDGALLLIDLDHFKQVNDRHGHAAGDTVLIAVAQRLGTALRADDLLLRWGGEEFLVLATARDGPALQALALRLLDEIGRLPVRLPGGDALRVTASLGFAAFPLQPGGLVPDWDTALDLVDSALYLAKSHGRNRGCGIAGLEASDSNTLRRIGRQLEAAQAAGRVSLVHLPGPAGSPDTAGQPGAAASAAPPQQVPA